MARRRATVAAGSGPAPLKIARARGRGATPSAPPGPTPTADAGTRKPGRPALEGGAAVLYVRLPVPLRERLRAISEGRDEAAVVREILEAGVSRAERRAAMR